jgi:hypothetical protein
MHESKSRIAASRPAHGRPPCEFAMRVLHCDAGILAQVRRAPADTIFGEL